MRIQPWAFLSPQGCRLTHTLPVHGWGWGAGKEQRALVAAVAFPMPALLCNWGRDVLRQSLGCWEGADGHRSGYSRQSLSSVKAAMGSRELWEECCVPMQHYLQTQQPAGLGLGFSFADP